MNVTPHSPEGIGAAAPGLTAHSARQKRWHLLALLATLCLPAALFPLLARSGGQVGADFHSTIELAGALLGLIVGFALIHRFFSLNNRFFLCIGLAFFLNGAYDFIHGLLVLVLKQPHNPYLFAVGRVSLGVLLPIAPLLQKRWPRSTHQRRETVYGILVALALCAATTSLFFSPHPPPLAGAGRFIERPWDYLAAVALLTAFVVFLLKYQRDRDMLTWWILLSIGVNMAGQLMMSFSPGVATAPYDALFAAAYVCKLLGYMAPLLGFSLYHVLIVLDRQRAQAALGESEIKYRTLFESTGEAVMLLDDEGFLDCNQATLRIFGFGERGEFIGRHPAELSPPSQPSGRNSAELAQERIDAAYQTGRAEFEWTHCRSDGTDFPAEVSLTAFELSGRGLLQAVVRDITARKQAEEALRHRVRFEGLITTISSNFINLAPDAIDAGIQDALYAIGVFSGLDRGYVFKMSDDGNAVDNTHEWCAKGVEPQIERQRSLPVEALPWRMRKLRDFESIHIPRVAELPPAAAREKEALEALGVRSAVIIPMVYSGRLIGFLGFDAIRAEHDWPDDIVMLLILVGEIFINALERKRVAAAEAAAERALRESAEQARTFSAQLTALHEVGNTLTNIDGFDDLCRAGVELGRECFGFDRLGLWFYNRQEDCMYGSFGTDEEGRTRDERHARQHEIPAAIEREILEEKSRLIALRDNELLSPDGVVGRGDQTVAALWDGEEVIGYISADNLLSGRPLTDSDNEILALYASTLGHLFRRRRSEKALRQSEERYRSITEAVTGYIFTVHVEQGRAARTTHGATCEVVTGYAAKEFAADPELWIQMVPEPDRELVHRQAADTLAGRAAPPIEHRIRRKDGAERWVRNTVVLHFDPNGRLRAYEGLIDDITERKRAQQALELANVELEERVLRRTRQLRQARDAAEAGSRAKSEFLANMSHEIRTPLNGIAPMLNLLLKTELHDRQREFADTARRCCSNLTRLVNDILDFSKIEAGKLELESVAFDLRQCVDEVGAMLAKKAAQKRIELIVEYGPDAPRWVLGDPVRLHQVLINLVSNAIKFTDAGEVFVHVSLAPPGESKGEDAAAFDGDQYTLKFEVSDTGIGIPERRRDSIFETFIQIDASTTRKYGGAGLGLSISKRLVSLMGGEIGVRGNEERGSTFWFTAVVGRNVKIPESGEAEQRRILQPLAGARVLVVDENDSNRAALVRLLERWGCRSAAAGDVFETIGLLRGAPESSEGAFQAALIDYRVAIESSGVPEVGDLELARLIQSDAQVPELPLLLLSLPHSALTADAARELGFVGLVTKPVREAALLHALAQALGVGDALAGAALSAPPPSGAPLRQYAVDGEKAGHARVLLVEDNTINQRIMLLLLEDMGIACTMAANGLEALAALEQSENGAEAFDAVLMDLQMPEMDGYEATHEIRRREKESEHRPIIALTAHAMKEVRDRCLAAGMDDFVSKPVEEDDLFRALSPYIPLVFTTLAEAPEKDAATPTAPDNLAPDQSAAGAFRIDEKALNKLLQYGEEAFRELAAAFVKNKTKAFDDIELALELDDRERAGMLAHSVKGSAAQLGIVQLAETAKELETHAPDAPLEALYALVVDLRDQMARARRYFQDNGYL